MVRSQVIVPPMFLGQDLSKRMDNCFIFLKIQIDLQMIHEFGWNSSATQD